MKRLIVALFAFWMIQKCEATTLPVGFQEDLVVYGLKQPVAAEFAPDGRLFIVEREGKIRIFKDGVLLEKPFLTVPVNDVFERGLLGMALDPNFENNHFVYIYRTTSSDEPKNRVERYTANGDVASLSSRKLIITDIRSDNGQHNAGCLRFGPDGKLYISTGDGGVDHETSQRLTEINGKILRLNPDGTIPSDNPFVGRAGTRPEIWAFGLRNPWRFAIHPQTGMVAIGDVGGDSFEEINIGRPGSNYGWPLAEGPATDPNFVNPVYFYSHKQDAQDAAVAGGFFYTGNQFPPRFKNRFFFTDYVRGFIKTLSLDEFGNVVNVENLASRLDTPVHMLEAPDGSLLYVSIRTGEIRRIRFVGGKNRPPIAIAKASRDSGREPFRVIFSSEGSGDPDHDPVQYHWDFGDGTFSDLPELKHTFTVKGIYFVVLTVTDSKGLSTNARSIRIVVGNEPPKAIILRPGPGLVVRPGDTVVFAGKGVDFEDGSISPRFLIWSAELHHNNHTHPFFNDVHGRKGSFVVPPAHDTGTLFFRLQLDVLDSATVRTSTFVDITFLQE